MPRAVLKDGLIHPVEPLPAEWDDGTQLQVEKAAESGSDGMKSRTDEWMDKVEALAASISPQDDDQLMASVAGIRKSEREAARRKAEWPE